MSTRAESLAGRAFSDAESTLHGLAIEDPRVPPPLTLVVSGAPPRRPEAIEPFPLVDLRTPHPLRLEGPTLTEALSQLESGQCTTRDLVERALEIASGQAHLGAVVAVDEKSVLQLADELDAERRGGKLRGSLHGLPITVKDVIDVAGLPTRGGSLAYADEPEFDAPAVGRLRDQGALILAKVATHEFALGVTTPQCRNPHDPTRIAGGSSGGSAIAVASGIGVGSLGTDTRASLRVPAALCGVVGFKPTFGRVPAAGIIPLSWTIDHLGPITRTVEDAAMLLDALAGAPFLLRDPVRPPGVLGIVPAVFEDADPLVAETTKAALGLLVARGWGLVEIDGPSIEDLELSNALGLLVSRSEAATVHRSLGTDLSLCIPEVRDQLAAGLTITAADYLDAQRQRAILGARTLEQFARCDVIVTPTSPVVAPPADDYERYLLRLSRNTIIWSLNGGPAVSLPCGVGEHGLPVGLQLAAAPGNEQALVDAGMTLERALRLQD